MKKYGLVWPQDQQGAKAVPVCSEVLSTDPQNVNALKDRAEAYLQDEQYENGKSTLSFSQTFNPCILPSYYNE